MKKVLKMSLMNFIILLSIKNKIKLVGFSNEVKRYLDKSDIYIFPSYEGLSNSFLKL